jgi:hypothetical protein
MQRKQSPGIRLRLLGALVGLLPALKVCTATSHSKDAMHLDRLNFHPGPAGVLKTEIAPLRGVFLTHLHPDHIGGLSEIPLDTPNIC